MRHVIQKQTIEFQMVDKKKFYQMQLRLRRLFKRKIIPLIDRYCSEFSGSHEIHRIDRIVIDLGKLNPSDIENSFLQKTAPLLSQQLKAAIQRTPSIPASVPKSKQQQHPQTASKTEPLYHEPLQARKTAIQRTSSTPNSTSKSKQQQHPQTAYEADASHRQALQDHQAEASFASSSLQQWLFFIRTGSLPWWTRKPTRALLYELLQQIGELPASTLKRTLSTIAAQPKQLQRLLNHTSDKELFKLLSATIPAYAGLVKTLYQALDKLKAAERSQSKKRFLHWQALLLALAASSTTRETQQTFLQRILLDIAVARRLSYRKLLETLSQSTSQQLKPSLMALQKPESNANATKAFNDNKDENENEDEDDDPIIHDVDSPFNDSDKLYLENAGIVLLHPFLNQFFENLQLVKKDEKDKEALPWVSASAQQRAALLLQYLVTGKPKGIIEPQLPLNKIFCGLDLEEPIPVDLALGKEDIAACEELLQAVIGHHEMWKGLNINDFRRAHLQREGLLSTRDGGWLLRVERKTYDVIIDHLPWSISIVRTPWMASFLAVEW